MRRALLIFAILVVIIGTGSFVYFRFFYKPGLVVTPADQAGLPVAGQGSTTPFQNTQNASSPAAQAGPTIVAAKLIRIASGPVVPGVAVIDATSTGAGTTTESYPVAAYIDRQSGNVYNYSAQSGRITRVSNKTIPSIEQAYWLPDASMAFVQYLSDPSLNTINTYGLPATGNGGFFLSQDLSGLAVSTDHILSLATGVNGSIATLESTSGTDIAQAFSTPLTAIRVAFAGKNQYLVFTKPAATLSGYSYLVTGGHFVRFAGPLNGLVALVSPSGEWALVSYTDGSQMLMELVDTTTGSALPLPVATIADKCAWTADSTQVYCGIPDSPPQGSYPDDWYQGVTHFSDSLWKIEVSGRYVQLVDRISQDANTALDVEQPSIDPTTQAIVFTNKNDGSLWLYKLQ